MSKYGVFSGPYLPACGLNAAPYSVRMRQNTDQKRLCIWTLFTQCFLVWYLFHPVNINSIIFRSSHSSVLKISYWGHWKKVHLLKIVHFWSLVQFYLCWFLFVVANVSPFPASLFVFCTNDLRYLQPPFHNPKKSSILSITVFNYEI